MTNTTPDQEAMLALMREARTRLDRPHTNIKDVTAMLVEGGMEPQQASDTVGDILRGIRERQREKEETARKDLLIGGLILVVGIAITVISYYKASGGGTYVVTWGAMLWGGMRLFKGLSNG
ncbi:MAG: hypothetical protein JST66_04605 [Bacteroidetes bacterium]|nr:hypothetical protein [Bacteroidota bacterium]